MVAAASALGPLSCPRCAGALRSADGSLTCASCSLVFPFVGAIPCLMEDPVLWRALWASRLEEYLALVTKRVFFSQQELALPDRLPRTKQRIARLMAGLEAQQEKIAALLRPLSADALAVPPRPEARQSLALLECYENIFRDWGWGSAEIDRVRALIEPAFPDRVGTLAIYGAGAGRLAVDVHRSRKPERTYALDVNPLPLMVADALLRGETVALPEMPVAPHRWEQGVIEHELRFAAGAGDGFQLLFADALRPPLAPGTVDVVLTAWFIDAVPADLRVTAAAINRVLRPEGLWINFGPLRFVGELSQQYSIEEVHELVGAASFALQSTSRHDLPYFDSPYSGSRPVETAFSFSAKKTGDASPRPVPGRVAPWIADPRLPIPMSPPLVALGEMSVFTASMLNLVDGTRSMADVADTLAGAWQMDPPVILAQLRAFFAKLPE